jgi:hypothetical protein
MNVHESLETNFLFIIHSTGICSYVHSLWAGSCFREHSVHFISRWLPLVNASTWLRLFSNFNRRLPAEFLRAFCIKVFSLLGLEKRVFCFLIDWLGNMGFVPPEFLRGLTCPFVC